MAYKVQRRVDSVKEWTDVAEFESLDEAIERAMKTERLAPSSKDRATDIHARIVCGKRVIWT